MDARSQFFGQIVQQGHVVAQTVLSQLQQQVLQLVQQAVGQLSTLVNSIGRIDFSFQSVVDQLKPVVTGAINSVLVQIIGSLQGLIGSRASIDLAAIFNGFLSEVQGAIVSIGQHVFNQGLASVIGGLGSLGGSRAISDIFAGLSQQISAAVTAAQGALTGALGNLSALGSNIVDASKPHFQQLQEQLVGHGLNVLGSISETINNLHGSITGSR